MRFMRTPLAVLVCLLLSGVAAPVAFADLLPPPEATPEATPPVDSPSETGSDISPIESERPARPSWSLGVVAMLAMSVLIFVYLRQRHTLPKASPLDPPT